MARNSPNPGQKMLYFLLISISISILYVDIQTDTFSGTKNNFKSVKISSKYLYLKEVNELSRDISKTINIQLKKITKPRKKIKNLNLKILSITLSL